MLTKQQLYCELKKLGIEKGMILEVHSSLSSFGELEGGALTVIDTLKELVTEHGSIFMPALRLSRELELTDEDKAMGITVKIKILDRNEKRTAMGIVADTFRALPDTFTGTDVISTSGWGKHGRQALDGGLEYALNNGGKALMLGTDIYKLTAMHYVEYLTPQDINDMFAPDDAVNEKYPPDKWFMEKGHPPVKAWYKIQNKAFERGLIKKCFIGKCPVMFFDIKDVVSIYEDELRNDPYGLWEIRKI
ncbi:MAG: AAC(3) family N-acetyltransferase [Ruminococcus sp.]|nr:AAC(3) family N-acetyltransferase [Ruminococcus sp.]